jgi:anaerobic selenocysteine-containing dehydrogenase
MYALFARMYGTNNLPDSSNMCHESTSVALPNSIGVPVGTVVLDDFHKTDCILFFGNNTSVTSPRMLHDLQLCANRGVPIIVFNPLRERGFERFINPQSPFEMLSGSATQISTQYHQIRVSGDKARAAGRDPVLDRDHIASLVRAHGLATYEAPANELLSRALAIRPALLF